jgi:hypothetical protein
MYNVLDRNNVGPCFLSYDRINNRGGLYHKLFQWWGIQAGQQNVHIDNHHDVSLQPIGHLE